jgi:hypothetical protein
MLLLRSLSTAYKVNESIVSLTTISNTQKSTDDGANMNTLPRVTFAA